MMLQSPFCAILSGSTGRLPEAWERTKGHLVVNFRTKIVILSDKENDPAIIEDERKQDLGLDLTATLGAEIRLGRTAS
jgi:hypothetical protein